MRREGLYFGLLGLLVGTLLGAAACQAGTDFACPSKTCVGSSEVTPVSDRGYYDAAHKAVSGAKESIHIIAYEADYYPSYPDSTVSLFVRELAYARERGVDVKVYYYDISPVALAFLRSNGVETRWAGNDTITHSKVLIIDGKVVILGSTNLTHFGFDLNHEADVVIANEKTAEYFESYFQSMWNKQD